MAMKLRALSCGGGGNAVGAAGVATPVAAALAAGACACLSLDPQPARPQLTLTARASTNRVDLKLMKSWNGPVKGNERVCKGNEKVMESQCSPGRRSPRASQRRVLHAPRRRPR